MIQRLLKVTAATFLFACLATTSAPAQDDAETEREPRQSGVQEEVQVTLVEIKVRVTGKGGRPVTDLTPEEVKILEGGVEQKLAYFEPLALRGAKDALATPVPVYDDSGGRSQGRVDMILPPKPVRRIVFAFDPRNSRIPVRDNWKESATDWVREKMEPGDSAAVVKLSTYPEWLGSFSSDKFEVLNQLSSLDLYTNIPNRNRRDEVSDIVSDYSGLCADHVGRSQTSESANGTGGDVGQNDIGCAFQIAQQMSAEWAAQTKETFDVVRSLSGQLAAVPGEKILILFSEGIVDDPATVLVTTMLSVFGPQKIDLSAMMSRLNRGTHRELTAMQETASVSDVVIYAIDTRHPSEGSDFNNLERTSTMATGTSGVNPWQEMYNATTAPLSSLADATGGKFFWGPDELEEKISDAADSFYGVYSLGYYRADPTRAGKIKIKIDRKKIDLIYDRKPRRAKHQPGYARVDLVVGLPRQTMGGELQALPLSLIAPLAHLPLRPGGKGRGCEVGVFVQAVNPAGEIVAESFETITVVLPKDEYDEKRKADWRHAIYLRVPDGPIRIRARLSDDRQEIMADAAIDLTVLPGNVVGGLHTLDPNEPTPARKEGS